jgi:hypothetical protein
VYAGVNFNDLYVMNPYPNVSWRVLSRVGSVPSPRAYHGLVGEGGRLYVFAGENIETGEGQWHTVFYIESWSLSSRSRIVGMAFFSCSLTLRLQWCRRVE